MPIVRNRGFRPHNGTSEIVYHLQGSTIYGVKLEPYSVDFNSASYSDTWYIVDQSTGQFLQTTTQQNTILNEVGFKNRFDYSGYIPDKYQHLFVEIGNRHFPIRSVSRSTGANIPGTETVRIELSGRQRIDSAPNEYIYKFRLKTTSAQYNSNWIGARLQTHSGYDTLPYVIIRSWKSDPKDSRNIIAVFENNADALLISAIDTFYVARKYWNCIVTIDDINPFYDFNGPTAKDYTSSTVKVISCHPYDRGLSIKSNDNSNTDLFTWIKSDKLNLRKPNFFDSVSTITNGDPYWDTGIRHGILGDTYTIWHDGVWNISTQLGSQNIKIAPFSSIESNSTHLSYLEGAAVISLDSGEPFGYGCIQSKHPAYALGNWINDGVISWRYNPEEISQFIIQFNINTRVRFGNSEKVITFNSPDANKRRILLDSEPNISFLCSDSKPGVHVDGMGVLDYIYVADTLEKPSNNNSLDSKLLCEFKTNRQNWCSSSLLQAPWQGIIISDSLGIQDDTNWYINSCYGTAGNWRSTLERWRGPIITFGGGNASTENSDYIYNIDAWFDHRCQTGILGGQLWCARDSYTTNLFSKDDAPISNEKLNSCRWIIKPVYLSSMLKHISGTSTYEALVLFGKRRGYVNWFSDAAFANNNRFQFTFNTYATKDTDFETGNNLTHLISVGEPTIRTNFQLKHLDGWSDGARELWWDGNSWHLRCVGGGDAESVAGDSYKGNWGLNDISVSSAASWRVSGDEWQNAFIDASGSTSNNNATYVSSTKTIIGGDSTQQRNWRNWIDLENDSENNVAIPYLPHIGEIEIQPSGNYNILSLTGSSYQKVADVNRYVQTGAHSFLLNDMDPSNSNIVSQNTYNIHGHYWRINNSVIPYVLSIVQPIKFNFNWDWEKDLDITDGRTVTLGAVALDGCYHFDIYIGGQDYLKLNQRDRKDFYGTFGKSEIDSLWGYMFDLHEECVISVPRLSDYGTWFSHSVRQEDNQNYNQITGDKSSLPILLNNGRTSVIKAQTAHSISMQLNSIQPQYAGGIQSNESIANVTRTFDVTLKNTGTSAIYVNPGNAILYVRTLTNQKIALATNSTSLTVFPNTTVQWVLGTPINVIPESYGNNNLEFEITTTTGRYIVGLLTGSDGLKILRDPVVRCINDNTHTFVVEADAMGQIRGNVSYGDLLTTGGKQKRYTKNHLCSWYVKIKHEGDLDYATIEDISTSSTLTFYDPNNTSIFSNINIASMPDGDFLDRQESIGLITNALSMSNNTSSAALSVSGYVTGVLRDINVTGQNESGVAITDTHNLLFEDPIVITNDTSRFVLKNENLPAQYDENYIYIQDNADLDLSGYFIKDAGTASLLGLNGYMQWEPMLADGHSIPPDHWFGDATISFTSNECSFNTGPNWTPEIGVVADKIQTYNIVWRPNSGAEPWRDTNMAPVSTPYIILNDKPVKFYGAATIDISSMQQTSTGRILLVCNYKTGLINNCKIRILVNGMPALVTSALSTTTSGDSIVYGYADPTVIEQQGGEIGTEIWRAKRTIVSEVNSVFGVVYGADRWNPAFRDSDTWHWTEVITESNKTHQITLEIDTKHWAYHGGITHSYNSFNDGFTYPASRLYTNGLKEYQGPIRIKAEIEETLPPVGISSYETNYQFSYKRPVLGAISSAAQNYENTSASFKVPLITMYAPQYTTPAASLFLGDFPVDDTNGWTNISTVQNTTINYTINNAVKNSWAGAYLKLFDNCGNSAYGYYIRPHDLNADNSDNIPQTYYGPISIYNDVDRNIFVPKSGSNIIFAANNLTDDIAIKDWDLIARVTSAGASPVNYIIDPSATWVDKYTTLVGRWAYNWNNVNNAGFSPCWNFQNIADQKNLINPAAITDGFSCRGGYDYEGIVTYIDGYDLHLNNSIVIAQCDISTIIYNTDGSVIPFNSIVTGDKIGITGYYTSDIVLHATLVNKVTSLNGIRDNVATTEWDAQIQQYVLLAETYDWNTLLYKQQTFYLKNNGTRYDTAFVTYKLNPVSAAHPSRRRIDDRKIRAYVECDAENSVYTKSFSAIDDGQWHTAIIRDIADTNDTIHCLRLKFSFDNREDEYTEPVRELDSGTTSHGLRFRIANIGFVPQNFEYVQNANLFLNQYVLPVTLDGNDSLQLGIRVEDFAGHQVDTMNSAVYYVAPKDPGTLTLQHVDSDDGRLYATVIDFDTSGESAVDIEYRIGYSISSSLTNPIYLDNGAWHTHAQWMSGNYKTNELIEGTIYYFYVVARNPYSVPYIYNANHNNPTVTQFKVGYITPIITFASHLSRAIHNYSNGNYLDTNRLEWTQGDRQMERSSNYNQTNEGYHFKSKWYDGVDNWMPNISADSKDKAVVFKIWDVRTNFPVDGWFYSISYGSDTQLTQPSSSDSEVSSFSGNEASIIFNFISSYRGYAYLHVRPYYFNNIGVKTLFNDKHTIHVAFYLQYEDGLFPLPGSIYSVIADEVDDGSGSIHNYNTEPVWDNDIYRMKIVPYGTQGIHDSLGTYTEDEEGIRWQPYFKIHGDSVVGIGVLNAEPYTYNGDQPIYAPTLYTLNENTQYDIAIRAYSQGGAYGPLTVYGNSTFTNIRPANNILSIASNNTQATVFFTGLASENNAGKYEIWNYSKNESVDFIDYDYSGTYNFDIDVDYGDISAYIIKSYNGDNILLNNYPFKRHLDSASQYLWRPSMFVFMQDLIAPSVLAGIGYMEGSSSRYFSIKPSLENMPNTSWYNGTKLITDAITHENIEDKLYYCCKVFADNRETILGYINLNNPSVLLSNIDNAWFTYSQWSSTQVSYIINDFNILYGFQLKARKSTDILKLNGNPNLFSDQLSVCDNPEGDQVVYSDWGEIFWTHPYPKTEDDYNQNLHLFTQWKWSENPSLEYSKSSVAQDISNNFAALEDFRVSFKILSSETSEIEKLPNSILELPILEDNKYILPMVQLVLEINIKTSINVYTYNILLWSNLSLNENISNINELYEYYGIYNNIGLMEQEDSSICDNFSKFIPTQSAPLKSDQWYHYKFNLYNKILDILSINSDNIENIEKIRIKINATALKGNVYNPSRYSSTINWGDALWKNYDETSLGVLIRNISIGWTSQIDPLGRELYDETSWNGAYLWSVANFALKYNKAYEIYVNNKDYFMNKPTQYIEKTSSWSPANSWIYDSYVKNLISDEKEGNSVFNIFGTD